MMMNKVFFIDRLSHKYTPAGENNYIGSFEFLAVAAYRLPRVLSLIHTDDVHATKLPSFVASATVFVKIGM